MSKRKWWAGGIRKPLWQGASIVIIVCLILSVSIITNASETSAYSEVPGFSTGYVKVLMGEATDSQMMVHFDIEDFTREVVDINGEPYTKLGCGEEGLLLNKGEPELPYISRSIIIPDNANAKLRIVSSEYKDYENIKIAPSKGNLLRSIKPEEVEYTFGSVYGKNEWYPSDVASVREPYILRDYRGTVIDIYPFVYHPVKNTLRVYTSITVEVVNEKPEGMSTLSSSREAKKPVKEFDAIYKSRFINYKKTQELNLMRAGAPVDEKGELLIITYDNFYNAMKPFQEWKLQKGIPTKMVKMSEVSPSNNSNEIRSYIQNYYNSNRELCWVLLVGDVRQVASPYVGEGLSDPTYAKVAGNDNYPDIIIGRFSAESTGDVQTQVERSIQYERDMDSNDSWIEKAVGIASDEGSSQKDWQHMDKIRSTLLNFTYSGVDRIYDPGASAYTVSQSLNSGRGLINYCGHGSATSWGTTGFSKSNIQSLSNSEMLPFIFSVACVNGKFDYSYACFAETWLRSTNSQGRPIGAVGTYMSTINQPWVPPMVAQNEFIRLLSSKTKTTFGGLCYNASVKMLDTQGSNGVTTFNAWTIFGDPSLGVRTDTPENMTVNHTGNIKAGTSSYAVEVPGVAGALCSLYANGKNYGYAYTGWDGKANIQLTQPLSEGELLKLTVTAFNKVSKIQEVLVGTGGGGTPTPKITPTPTPVVTATPTPTSTPITTPTGNPGVKEWSPNSVSYQVGDLVSYKGKVYQCYQPHTSNVAWSPVDTINILWKQYDGPISTPTPTPVTTPTPTPTATPTPTPTSIGYRVSGYVVPGFSFSDSVAPILKAGFTVEEGCTGTKVVTDANGYFEFSHLPKGVCTLRISKPNYLYREVSVTIDKDVVISTPIELWFGDMAKNGVQDDAINMTDVMEVIKAFNSAKGDGKYVEALDINKDNAINMTDIMIIIRHFNTTPSSYPELVF